MLIVYKKSQKNIHKLSGQNNNETNSIIKSKPININLYNTPNNFFTNNSSKGRILEHFPEQFMQTDSGIRGDHQPVVPGDKSCLHDEGQCEQEVWHSVRNPAFPVMTFVLKQAFYHQVALYLHCSGTLHLHVWRRKWCIVV